MINLPLNKSSQEATIMTAEPSEKKTGKILTPIEREICENIAAQGDSLSSQRAELLLHIDEGMTQANACATSDLSIGQLRYALTLFKKSGMQMFPQEEAPITPPEAAPIAPQDTILIKTQEPVEEVVEPAEPVKLIEEEKVVEPPKKKKSKDKKKKKKVQQQKVDKPKKNKVKKKKKKKKKKDKKK